MMDIHILRVIFIYCLILGGKETYSYIHKAWRVNRYSASVFKKSTEFDDQSSSNKALTPAPLRLKVSGTKQSWKQNIRRRGKIMEASSQRVFNVEDLIVTKIVEHIEEHTGKTNTTLKKQLKDRHRRKLPLKAFHRIVTMKAQRFNLPRYSNPKFEERYIFSELMSSLYTTRGEHFFRVDPNCMNISMKCLRHCAVVGDLKSASTILKAISTYPVPYIQSPLDIFKLVSGLMRWSVDKGLYEDGLELATTCLSNCDGIMEKSEDFDIYYESELEQLQEHREIMFQTSFLAALRAHVSNAYLLLELDRARQEERERGMVLQDIEHKTRVHNIKFENKQMEERLNDLLTRKNLIELIKKNSTLTPTKTQTQTNTPTKTYTNANSNPNPNLKAAVPGDLKEKPGTLIERSSFLISTGERFILDIFDTLAAADVVEDSVASTVMLALLQEMGVGVSESKRGMLRKEFKEHHDLLSHKGREGEEREEDEE